MFKKPTHLVASLLGILCCVMSFSAKSFAGEEGQVFQAFTAHIHRQVEKDKVVFVQASTCTEWFYKQLRSKPQGPTVEGVAQHSHPDRLIEAGRPAETSLDCEAHYPGGLKAAREDFSRTQSTLTLSLTFYEFALVGDRDDDDHYNPGELQDILESVGLQFNFGLAPGTQASALNSQFDSFHQNGELEQLVVGMGTLFDKGYRLTNRDQQALNKIMG